jgi:hypothetical protein
LDSGRKVSRWAKYGGFGYAGRVVLDNSYFPPHHMMNVNPDFRYYTAFALILMLVLLLRVQSHPDAATQPVEDAAASQLVVSTSNR